VQPTNDLYPGYGLYPEGGKEANDIREQAALARAIARAEAKGKKAPKNLKGSASTSKIPSKKPSQGGPITSPSDQGGHRNVLNAPPLLSVMPEAMNSSSEVEAEGGEGGGGQRRRNLEPVIPLDAPANQIAPTDLSSSAIVGSNAFMNSSFYYPPMSRDMEGRVPQRSPTDQARRRSRTCSPGAVSEGQNNSMMSLWGGNSGGFGLERQGSSILDMTGMPPTQIVQSSGNLNPNAGKGLVLQRQATGLAGRDPLQEAFEEELVHAKSTASPTKKKKTLHRSQSSATVARGLNSPSLNQPVNRSASIGRLQSSGNIGNLDAIDGAGAGGAGMGLDKDSGKWSPRASSPENFEPPTGSPLLSEGN